MDGEFFTALIGVIGTVIGTVLGWILNNLSKNGKLNVYVTIFKDMFQYNALGHMENSTSKEVTDCYSYNLSVDLHNSSGESKIMRNMSIVFSDGNKELFRDIPKDDSTQQRTGPIRFYDEIGAVNIPPKTVIQLDLHGGFWKSKDDFELIWGTKKIYLEYLDDKNKVKTVDIKTVEYENYFTQTQEET